MPSIPKRAQTDGSKTFAPDAFFDAWARDEIGAPQDDDFRTFVIRSFGLQPDDDYGYRATAEVTLLQAQKYLMMSADRGLHRWYVEADSSAVSSDQIEVSTLQS